MYRCLVCGVVLRSDQPNVLIRHLRQKHPFINVNSYNRRSCSPYAPFPQSPGRLPAACLGPCPPPCAVPQIPLAPRCAPPPPPCPPCPPILPPCPTDPCRRCGPCGPCPPQPCPPPPPCPPVPCPATCAVPCPGPTREEYCRAYRDQKRREYRTKYKCTVESWKPGCTKVVCPCCGCESQPIIRRQKNQLAESSLGACLMLMCMPLSCLPFMLCESTLVNLYCAQCNNFLGAYNRKLGCVVDVEANMCNPGITPAFPSVP